MTHYCMNLILEKWIAPHVDTAAWEHFDLSCVNRDATEDKVLHDAVAAGSRVCAIFKEPTVTPTEVQKEALGLKKAWGSPNGAMRRGWNGITISRDTIHIPGTFLTLFFFSVSVSKYCYCSIVSSPPNTFPLTL